MRIQCHLERSREQHFTCARALTQAGSAYAMSFAFARTGSYLPLYDAGAVIEAIGMICGWSRYLTVTVAASRLTTGNFVPRGISVSP